MEITRDKKSPLKEASLGQLLSYVLDSYVRLSNKPEASEACRESRENKGCNNCGLACIANVRHSSVHDMGRQSTKVKPVPGGPWMIVRRVSSVFMSICLTALS